MSRWARARSPSPRARGSSNPASASNGDCGEAAASEIRRHQPATGVERVPPMTGRVAIVGAALSDCGRVDTKSAFELHYQAASRAIADAGLTKDDIDGVGSSGIGLLTPIEISEYMGLRPTWVDGTGVGGSTWEFMVEHATAAIQ